MAKRTNKASESDASGSLDESVGDSHESRSGEAPRSSQAAGDNAAGNDHADADSASQKTGFSGTTDDADYPQTSCPNCQTVFEVSPEFLTSDDTRVRCGECLIIFDSLTNLKNDEFIEDDDFMVDEHGNIIESDSMLSGAESLTDDVSGTGSFRDTSVLSDARAAALAGLSNDEAALDMTYSDVDLFSEDAGLPEVLYFDRTQNTDGYDDTSIEPDETFSDTLFSADMTADVLSTNETVSVAESPDEHALNKTVDFVSDDTPPDPLVFNYRDKQAEPPQDASVANGKETDQSGVDELLEQSRKKSRSYADEEIVLTDQEPSLYQKSDNKRSIGFKILLALSCLVLFMSLYGYRERESLIINPTLRPILETACKYLSCSLPEQRDIASLQVLKRTVYTHPSIDNALVIDLAFANQADFRQPYPVLEIRLTDRNGGLVVMNSFYPDQYLKTWQTEDQLDVGQRVDVTLTVEDPGQTATSFELDFR